MSASVRTGLALVLGVLAAGCDHGSPSGPSTDPEPQPKVGISFVSGVQTTDTIGASPTQALVVEVRGSDGKVLPGVVVRFEAVPIGNTGTFEVNVAGLASASYSSFLSDSTRSNGRTAALVRFGRRAGTGRVVVSVPALGLQDTARYTIQPGAPAAVVSLPADTALFIGRTLRLGAAVVDRYGNARKDPVSFSASGSAASVGADGTVTGAAFGRTPVVVSAAGFSDTSLVSVVPQGTIAAYTRISNSGQRVGVYTVDLDGSNLTLVRETVVGAGYYGEMPAAWSPDGKQLVYHDNNTNHTRQLYVHDMATGASRRFLPTADQMEMESWPRRSPDGQWVYFSGGTYSSYQVYRARLDGTGKERISPAGTGVQWQAAPSPDGTRVMYVSGGDYSAGQLEVISLASRQVTRLAVNGLSPRWSPSGSEVVYLSQPNSYAESTGLLTVMNPDGTNRRTLTRSGDRYLPHLDYSPDGRYVIATSAAGVLTVVEVATGIEVPVRVTRLQAALVAPVWKP